MAEKWFDSIEKQKRRSNLKERDKQTERVNEKNNRLLARRGDQYSTATTDRSVAYP